MTGWTAGEENVVADAAVRTTPPWVLELPLGSVRQTVVRHTERPVVVARTESS